MNFDKSGARRLLTKIAAIMMLPSLVFSGYVSADTKPITAEKSTLATPSKINQDKLMEDFIARASALPNAAVGKFLAEEIKNEQDAFISTAGSEAKGMAAWREAKVIDQKVSQDQLVAQNLSGRITNDLPGFDEVKIVLVKGLFTHTLQFAHVGLTLKDDKGVAQSGKGPIIYLDSDYYLRANNAIQRHEIDEAIQAEKFRRELEKAYELAGKPIISVRAWINTHMNNADELLQGTAYAGQSAKAIWKAFHDQSYLLDELKAEVTAGGKEGFWGLVEKDYIADLVRTFKDKEEETINIAAFAPQVDTDEMLPTDTVFYKTLKTKTARSAFGEQLVFGTSGIRDLVLFLENIKCYSVAEAIMSFMKAKGYLDLDELVIAGDLRPSSPDIMKIALLAGIMWNKTVLCAGNLPTPAVAYYGMYRAEGAIPSVEITASHNPVLGSNPDFLKALLDEQNGVKPNTPTGEVLKEDELEILEQVRMFLELELMMQENICMFDRSGALKVREELNDQQRDALDKALAKRGELRAPKEGAAKREMPGQTDVSEKARQMYIDRYVKAFGKIFDGDDEMAFLAHMSVGRSIIRDIFTGLGLDSNTFNYMREGNDWERGLIVDTEDVKQPKKPTDFNFQTVVRGMRDECRAAGKHIKGIWSTDGDSDRPALFDENGSFIYGDKLGYLTCKYIADLDFCQNKPKLAVITATVSGTVQRMLEDLGYTVVKVEIGSPYVVKAMEDWSRDPKNKGGIAVGFERNGGFLLGSDIRLNNGNVLKKLATRDAMLPIIAAFSMAREKKCSIGQLVA
ncbi:MAG: hypothetical protein PHS37_08560, partial [Candidatus Omnitrophica bacterium]|nr:hypothetical protein [Candidatus Omnitrophota bacterium]